MKRVVAIILSVAGMLALTLPGGASATGRRAPLPVAASKSESQAAGPKFRRAARPAAGRYIVVLKDNAPEGFNVRVRADELAAHHGGKILFYYADALKGFAVELDERRAQALSENPLVDYVEEDNMVEALASPQIVEEGLLTQTYPPNWGLDRIDQRNLPLNNSYSWTKNGLGVHVYILDSGIRIDHAEFRGHASTDANFTHDSIQGWGCGWHATAMAGIIGGVTYGVAKRARLHSVRVLRCDTPSFDSEIIAGLNWIRTNALRPAVVNMSFAGTATSTSTAEEQAIRDLIASGITCVAGAGNVNQPASTIYPARMPEVITVGAVDSTDQRIAWTAYGYPIDLFAPGLNITSASSESTTATITQSGTSQATAHVTGVIAQYLQRNPSATPAAVAQYILNNATANKVVNPGDGALNKLLFSTLN